MGHRPDKLNKKSNPSDKTPRLGRVDESALGQVPIEGVPHSFFSSEGINNANASSGGNEPLEQLVTQLSSLAVDFQETHSIYVGLNRRLDQIEADQKQNIADQKQNIADQKQNIADQKRNKKSLERQGKALDRQEEALDCQGKALEYNEELLKRNGEQLEKVKAQFKANDRYLESLYKKHGLIHPRDRRKRSTDKVETATQAKANAPAFDFLYLNTLCQYLKRLVALISQAIAAFSTKPDSPNEQTDHNLSSTTNKPQEETLTPTFAS